jgi:hypothetical protein
MATPSLITTTLSSTTTQITSASFPFMIISSL